MQRVCALLSSVVFPALQYFSTLSHKYTIFAKKLVTIKCVFWSSVHFSSEIFLIPKGIERDMIYIVVYVKYHHPCQNLKCTCVFDDRYKKNTRISNFTKIYPVGADLLYAEGQTDMTKLIVAFRNFANAPKHEHKYFQYF